jgi:Nucleotidyltransferase domain
LNTGDIGVTLERFVAACREDTRVVAAFLGGSHAAGTADEYSDLDLYLIVGDHGYGTFFAERRAFPGHLGEPVFFEDFSDFGFDMVVFIFSSGGHRQTGTLGRPAPGPLSFRAPQILRRSTHRTE